MMNCSYETRPYVAAHSREAEGYEIVTKYKRQKQRRVVQLDI